MERKEPRLRKLVGRPLPFIKPQAQTPLFNFIAPQFLRSDVFAIVAPIKRTFKTQHSTKLAPHGIDFSRLAGLSGTRLTCCLPQYLVFFSSSLIGDEHGLLIQIRGGILPAASFVPVRFPSSGELVARSAHYHRPLALFSLLSAELTPAHVPISLFLMLCLLFLFESLRQGVSPCR